MDIQVKAVSSFGYKSSYNQEWFMVNFVVQNNDALLTPG